MQNNPLAKWLLNVHLFREAGGSNGGPAVMRGDGSLWLFLGGWGLIVSRRGAAPRGSVESTDANRDGYRAPVAGP